MRQSLPFADREGHVLEVGIVQLLDGGVEGVAVNVHESLRQVALALELCDVVVRPFHLFLQAALDLDALQLPLLGQEAVDLERERLVPVLLVGEVLAAFAGLVDDFRHRCLVHAVLARLGERRPQQRIFQSVVLMLLLLSLFFAVALLGHRDMSLVQAWTWICVRTNLWMVFVILIPDRLRHTIHDTGTSTLKEVGM